MPAKGSAFIGQLTDDQFFRPRGQRPGVFPRVSLVSAPRNPSKEASLKHVEERDRIEGRERKRESMIVNRGRGREYKGKDAKGRSPTRRGIRFWNRAVVGSRTRPDQTVLAGSLIKIFTRRDVRASGESSRHFVLSIIRCHVSYVFSAFKGFHTGALGRKEGGRGERERKQKKRARLVGVISTPREHITIIY